MKRMIYTAVAALLLSSVTAFTPVANAEQQPQGQPPQQQPTQQAPSHAKVPEPATMILLGSGLLGLGAAWRLRKEDRE